MSVVTEDDFILALNSEAEYDSHDDTAVCDAVYQAPEMSANSILSLFDSSKEQRMSFVMQILEDMDEGRKDPRLVHVNVKNMEDILDMLNDKKKYPVTATAYRKMLMDECEKYGKSFEFHNANFSIRGTGGKTDYSQCGDPTIIELEAEFEAAKAKLDERKKYLDNLPIKGVQSVDIETGQLTHLYPPSKPKSETVFVNLS